MKENIEKQEIKTEAVHKPRARKTGKEAEKAEPEPLRSGREISAELKKTRKELEALEARLPRPRTEPEERRAEELKKKIPELEKELGKSREKIFADARAKMKEALETLAELNKTEREKLEKIFEGLLEDSLPAILSGKEIEPEKIISRFSGVLAENIDKLPADVFPGINRLVKEDPEIFKKIKEDLKSAFAEKDGEKRGQKLKEAAEKYRLSEEAQDEIEGINEVILLIQDAMETDDLVPEKREELAKQARELKGKVGKLWDKSRSFLGILGGIMLAGLALTLLLLIVFFERAGGSKRK